MTKTTVIFDLDGTLLDTLADLHASVNRTLSAFGLPKRSRDEIQSFLGHGTRYLIAHSAPDADNELLEKLLAAYRKDYIAHSADRTLPYPGVTATLQTLFEKGYKLAVLSNKPEEMTKALCASLLPPVFSVVRGDREGAPRKPSPEPVLFILQTIGETKENCIYVGDSDVDVQTAKNAGVYCLSALWGYRSKDELRAAGAERFLSSPSDILAYTERTLL